MLAIPRDAPFSDPAWLFELKWDGVRCLLSSDPSGIRLHSRAGNEMTQRYPEITTAELPQELVLDGEIVALDDQGRPSFERLQSRMNVVPPTGSKPVSVSYVVFDILHEGRSLVDLPLEKRQLQRPGNTQSKIARSSSGSKRPARQRHMRVRLR